MSTVTLEQQNKIAVITLNREDKRNALTQSMWEALADYCDQLAKGPIPRVVVIQAQGDKAFSAGADIEELTQIIQDPVRLKLNNKVVQEAQQKLHNLPCPTVAAINGACVGGGMGIAVACDFRIAARHAKFAITPSKLGLLYSIEDTRRLVALVGMSKAKQLLYLGQPIDAQTALTWGLLTHVVKADELAGKVDELCNQLCQVSGTSIAGIKQTLGYLGNTLETDEKEVRALFDRAFYQDDFKRGSEAFLNKQPAEFE